MYKKKPLFITFEGIEGSGKSYQALRLYKNLKKKNNSSILTREPGGTRSAEKIREVILKDYFHSESIEKFKKYTDTLDKVHHTDITKIHPRYEKYITINKTRGYHADRLQPGLPYFTAPFISLYLKQDSAGLQRSQVDSNSDSVASRDIRVAPCCEFATNYEMYLEQDVELKTAITNYWESSEMQQLRQTVVISI